MTLFIQFKSLFKIRESFVHSATGNCTDVYFCIVVSGIFVLILFDLVSIFSQMLFFLLFVY